MVLRTACQRATVFAAGFANRILRYRTAFAGCRADFAAAFATIITHAGIVFAFVFGRIAAQAEAVGHITVRRRLFIGISITVTGIALAFFVRTVVRTALRAVQNITVPAGVDIAGVFAGSDLVFAALGIIFVIIRTRRARHIGRRLAGSYRITFVFALVGRVYGKIFATAAIAGFRVTVAETQKAHRGQPRPFAPRKSPASKSTRSKRPKSKEFSSNAKAGAVNKSTVNKEILALFLIVPRLSHKNLQKGAPE